MSKSNFLFLSLSLLASAQVAKEVNDLLSKQATYQSY